MHCSLRTAWTTAAITVTLVAALPAAIKFTSTFKSLDAGAVSFAGKKVAALVISNDDSLRVAAEESLARELSALGIQAVATYRMAPKEVLRSAETARPWFEKANVEGVVALRPVSAETQQEYTPTVWSSPNYGTLWGYYGYGWGSLYIPGSTQVDTVVVVETTIYSVPRNMLLWAGVSETKNPKQLGKFVEDLAGGIVKALHDQGLAKAVAK